MPYCPYCGAEDLGTASCTSCQRPIPRDAQPPPEAPPAPGPGVPPEGTPTAGLWRRFFALLADALILGIITDTIHMAYQWGLGRRGTAGEWRLDAALWLSTLVWILYFTLPVTERGQTIGKRLFGIKIVRVSGQGFSFGRALLRAIGYYVSAVPLFLGFMWALWDRRRQAWHDKLAGTIVVRT